MDNNNQKYDETGIDKNTYQLLFSDEYYNQSDENTEKNTYILKIIETYTRLRRKNILAKLLKIYYKKRYSIDFSKIIYNENSKEYEYRDELDGEIYTFDKLSNLIDCQEIKDELESNKRFRKMS